MRPRFDRPIAHRGMHDVTRGIAENSATAFEAAIAAGYAIECDLQLTADDVPMVFHDSDRQRLTGHPGRVRDTSAADLGTHPLVGSAAGDCPQTFAALLAQVDGRTLLQVELKHQADAAATAALAQAAAELAAAYAGPLAFMSFDPNLIGAVRAADFGGPIGIITYRYDDPNEPALAGITPWQRFSLRHLLHWPTSRFDFISAAANALDLPAIRLFRSLGMPVTSWTIRSGAGPASAGVRRPDRL